MFNAARCSVAALTLALPLGLALTPTSSALAQEGGSASTLKQLREEVQKANRADSKINKEREAEFRRDLDKLRGTLAAAERRRAEQEALSTQLEAQFQANDKELAELDVKLQERLGTLGELFGVFRQFAGDTREVVKSSITSAQYPGRVAIMDSLAQEKALPAVAELKQVWSTILAEMTYTGEVVKFDAPVVLTDGTSQPVPVVRVVPFNAVYEDNFLIWKSDTQSLAELRRQPEGRHRSAAEDLYTASANEMVSMSVDPSKGGILATIVDTPNLLEKFHEGGIVGYVITALGVVGLIILVIRLLALSAAGTKMRSQMKNTTPNPNNPLGRVMQVYEQNKDVEFETLELKLDETIIKEVPKIESGLTTLKVLSVVAPLLGLLGTVTGMINTFQQITLFGAGNPKLMAGGISTALVTTTLGLIVAIPLVLAHSFLRDRSKSLVQILEEQAAGMIARRAEQESSGAGTAG